MKYQELLANLEGCPFCDKENEFVIELPTAYLTYALAPYHSDHLLIITKRHLEHFLNINEKEKKDIDLLQRQGVNLLNQLGHKNISILVREGDGSGKSIPHLHYHLIPEISLGNINYSGEERLILSTEEIERLISRLKKALLDIKID